MSSRNVLKESLENGSFITTLEFTAPDVSESADDVNALAEFVGQDDRLAALAITDRVPSLTTYDPVDLALQAVELAGKTPMVHLSGKNRGPDNLQEKLHRMVEHELWNVLMITGDVPRLEVEDPEERLAAATEGFTDSVQAVHIAASEDQRFYVGAAVSSFKYLEATQMMQYIKMKAKVANGASMIFNQVGYDLRKTQEVAKYVRDNNVKTKLIAGLYWLTVPFAKFAAKGEVAGVVISDDLVARLVELGKAEDKGKAARQELMALHILLCKAWGYDGVHIGGFKKPGSLKEILDLADEIEQRNEGPDAWWARWCEILTFEDGRPCETGFPDGFYLYQKDDKGLNSDQINPESLAENKPNKSIKFRFMETMHDVFFGESMEPGGAINKFANVLGKSAPLAKLTYVLERAAKIPLVGCEGCGSCTLPETEYVCIQHECGKHLPNGPCGGQNCEGMCEGRPHRECAWVEIYNRAKAAGNLDKLLCTYVPPKDKSLEGSSSWINMAAGRDHRHSDVTDKPDPAPDVRVDG